MGKVDLKANLHQNPLKHLLIMKKFLIASLLIGICFQLVAYPITPQTLRKEIENSTYIVLSAIINPNLPVETSKYYDEETQDSVEINSFSPGGDGIAELVIQKVLKGRIRKDTIQVIYPGGMMSPRPPRYPDSMKVIAFLRYNKESDSYETVGLSYGTILFDLNESTTLYENLIEQYLDIAKIKSKKKKKYRVAKWLIECCKDRSTRWHGAYDLARDRHWISYYDQSIDEKFAEFLSSEDSSVLEQIFLSCDTINQTDLCLSGFVKQENNEQLKMILIFNMGFFRSFFSEYLMKRFLEINDNPQLREVYVEYSDLSHFDEDDKERAKYLNERFIALALE